MMAMQRMAGMTGMGWHIMVLTLALPVPAGIQAFAGITANNRDSGMVADRITISRVLRRPAMVGVLQVAALFVCLVVVREAGVLQPLELRAYDFFLELFVDEAAEDPRVALINITESDIQQLGQWPLSDESLAGLITTLQAHNPAVIGVDIYRDLPILPGSAALDALLSQHSNVIMVEKVGASARGCSATCCAGRIRAGRLLRPAGRSGRRSAAGTAVSR